MPQDKNLGLPISLAEGGWFAHVQAARLSQRKKT
jgi:hypothetical protein